MRCYEVLGWWPPVDDPNKPGHFLHSGKHMGFFVICKSGGDAVRAVEEKYPGIRIDSLHNKAAREVIVL